MARWICTRLLARCRERGRRGRSELSSSCFESCISLIKTVVVVSQSVYSASMIIFTVASLPYRPSHVSNSPLLQLLIVTFLEKRYRDGNQLVYIIFLPKRKRDTLLNLSLHPLYIHVGNNSFLAFCLSRKTTEEYPSRTNSSHEARSRRNERIYH